MAKKSEINKKGRLAKSTLSVVLAASMVLTSSSFVWAAPVEDIAIVEEGDTVVEAVEAPVEEAVGTGVDEVSEASVEENVRAVADVTVTVADATYTGEKVTPTVTVVDKNYGTLIEGKDYTLDFDNATCTDAGVNTAKVTVKFKPDGDYGVTPDKVQYFTIKPFELNVRNLDVSYTDAGRIYNGTVQKPSFTATSYTGMPTGFSASDVLEVVSYDSSYNLTDAGKQKVKLSCKSTNYTISGELGVYEYAIDQAAFSDDTVTVTPIPVNYTGSPVEAKVKVAVKGANPEVVIDPSQYTINYFKADGKPAAGPQTNVGEYDIQVVSKGTGNFKAGIVTATDGYVIRAVNFAAMVDDMTVAGTVQDKDNKRKYSFTYTGKEQGISASDIVIPGLTQDVDYTVDFTGTTELKDVNSASGTAATTTFKVKGINNFDGDVNEILITLAMLPKQLNKTDYTITAQCSKDSATPFVTIKDRDKELVKDTDFEVTKVSGKNTVKITGKGNYTTEKADGTDEPIEVPYTVADKILMNDTAITATLTGTYSWTGKQITPAATALTVKYNGNNMTFNTDYTISYGKNVDSGEDAGVIILTGKGDYAGTKEVKFDIAGTNIGSTYKIADMSDVSLASAKAGNGKQVPKVVFENGASAPASLTYTVKYFKGAKEITNDSEEFTKKGTITVKAFGTGKYSGETDAVTYEIKEGDDISTAAKSELIADQNYTGKAIEPTVVVKTTGASPVTLTLGKDYTVSYANNIDVGTAFVTIKGMGQYVGNLVTSFEIVGQMDQNFEFMAAQVRDIQKRTLKSKATTVKYDVLPKTDVTYTSSDEKVFTVDAKTGAIAYTGVGTATLTASAAASDKYKAETKTMTVKVLPVTPANVKVTSTAKKKITVKADEVKEAAKYQIRIQKDGHSSVYVNVDNKGDLSKVYTTKSSGKFNVWVRAYKTIDGVHHFSAWSAKKTVTVK